MPSRRETGTVACMGIYGDHVLPHIINFCCGMKQVDPLRERTCAGLQGRVLEIGFGSGHNVAFYPPKVTSVTAIEPSDSAWRIATKRLDTASVPIERGGLDGQSLPYPNASFDSALSTWTLCTIPDAVAALDEIRRVLVPGGQLHFVEHGLAPDAKVRRTQRRLEPMQKRMFGGCHLTREIADLITQAGFEIVELDEFYEEGAPKPMGAASLGIAAA